ncbi:hypothetical protein ACE38W_09970 [Chitinophaga sp. Hz27]|uniref:hypothetical protein n=1 Tax=Chitinophaga sp. Hz27 TaxID=3347169 RepID=UPI0035E35E7C
MKKILFTSIIALTGLLAKGQKSTDTTELFSRIRNIYMISRVAPIQYDFSIIYSQTSEIKEENSNDTLSSHIELSGNKMRTKSNEMEVMQNERYIVSVSQEEQQIMVGKTPVKPAVPAFELLNNEVIGKIMVNWEEKHLDKKKLLIVYCNPELGLSRMDILTDSRTGKMEEINLKFPGAIVPAPADSRSTSSKSYSAIKYLFSNYKPLPAEFTGFEESQYFDIVNKEFVPAAAFKGYQIFLAFPNL